MNRIKSVMFIVKTEPYVYYQIPQRLDSKEWTIIKKSWFSWIETWHKILWFETGVSEISDLTLPKAATDKRFEHPKL